MLDHDHGEEEDGDAVSYDNDFDKDHFDQEPLPEAAAVLLRHSWLCPLRGHGTLLSYDGFPPALRLLSTGDFAKASM